MDHLCRKDTPSKTFTYIQYVMTVLNDPKCTVSKFLFFIFQSVTTLFLECFNEVQLLFQEPGSGPGIPDSGHQWIYFDCVNDCSQ